MFCRVYSCTRVVWQTWNNPRSRRTFHVSGGRQWPPACWQHSSWEAPAAAASAGASPEPAAHLAADWALLQIPGLLGLDPALLGACSADGTPQQACHLTVESCQHEYPPQTKHRHLYQPGLLSRAIQSSADAHAGDEAVRESGGEPTSTAVLLIAASYPGGF